jgi:hypothetical protein
MEVTIKEPEKKAAVEAKIEEQSLKASAEKVAEL